MPDSGLVDNALVDKLNADATLIALLPGKFHFEEGPPGATRFGIVSLVDHVDVPAFQGRTFEESVYLVKAVALSTAATEGNMRAAAARIDTLLEGNPLTATGYTTMNVRRTARIRLTEVDEADPSIRWYHRGGQYEVVMST